MELLGFIAVIIIVIIIIYYINKSFECFENPSNEIDKIKGYYNLLKTETKNENKIILKQKIKDSIKVIEMSLKDNYYKYKLNNIYDNDLSPLLEKLDNDEKFLSIMNNIAFLMTYSANANEFNYSDIINQIKNDFKSLNDLYSAVYINKAYPYNSVENQIDSLNKDIQDGLLKLTSYKDLDDSGIILILNTSLKNAYQINDMTEINGLINTFNEKIRILNLIKNKNQSYEYDIKPLNTKNNVSVVQPTTTISLNKNKEVIKKIQEDFNKIYNSFDTINNIYENNGNKKQIDELKRVISESIDNIISYNKNDVRYTSSIKGIKIVIIAPILDKDLEMSYLSQDTNEIIKTKNNFYDGIIEIKNVIINSFSKAKDYDNRDVCLKDFIEAIVNNDFPIQIKKLKGCKNLDFTSYLGQTD